MTLADLPKNQSARIEAVADPALARLGVAVGMTATRQISAPLGDPIIYDFGGVRLALRRSQAKKIKIKIK